jgi:hypothetical protein
MAILKTFFCNWNKLTLGISSTRGFSETLNLSGPDNIRFSLASLFYIRFKIFVANNGNSILKIADAGNTFETIFQSVFSILCEKKLRKKYSFLRFVG